MSKRSYVSVILHTSTALGFLLSPGSTNDSRDAGVGRDDVVRWLLLVLGARDELQYRRGAIREHDAV